MGKTLLQLGPDDAGTLLSAEEFSAAEYKEPYIYERVKGRLVVMSPAGSEHRRVSRPFRRELGLYWGLHTDVVEEVDVEGWVSTSPDDDRIPDICVYLVGPSSDQTVPRRVPDLIFEFVSKDRSDQERDYIDKRQEYFAIGVKEYVIVDRFKQAVLVLTLKKGQDDYAEQWLRPPAEYTTSLLPGLRVQLQEVFT